MLKKKWNRNFILTACLSVSFVLPTFQVGYATIPASHEQHMGSNLLVQRAISQEEAKTIALKQVKGRIIHVDLDIDNGVTKYEVIIINEKNEVYEVEINASNGQVMKVEKEND